LCRRELPVSAFRIRTRANPKPRSHCRECETATSRSNYLAKPIETRKAATRRWEREHPDAVRLQVVRGRCRKAGVPEEAIPAVAAILASDPKCAICGRRASEIGRPHAIDHDHGTGKVRGILCEPCNMGLGKFGDDPNRLEAAANYLRHG